MATAPHLLAFWLSIHQTLQSRYGPDPVKHLVFAAASTCMPSADWPAAPLQALHNELGNFREPSVPDLSDEAESRVRRRTQLA